MEKNLEGLGVRSEDDELGDAAVESLRCLVRSLLQLLVVLFMCRGAREEGANERSVHNARYVQRDDECDTRRVICRELSQGASRPPRRGKKTQRHEPKDGAKVIWNGAHWCFFSSLNAISFGVRRGSAPSRTAACWTMSRMVMVSCASARGYALGLTSAILL